MRLVFAGTPEFAAAILDALIASPHTVAAVLTQPDRPAGRGRAARRSPVKARAERAGIPIRQPPSLTAPQALAALAGYAPQALVVAAYGLLLPEPVLSMPPLGCINVHASLLPRWRGAAPIQRAIEAGDSHTGVSIMRMDAGLDTGPVYLRRRCAIGDDDTAGSLHDRLAALGALALLEALEGIETGSLEPQPQDDRLATYAAKVAKEEARLDWRSDAATLERRVRAFNPSPMAFALLPGEREPRAPLRRLRVLRAAAVADAHASAPGTIVAASAAGIVVGCASGALRLEVVQRAGRQPMTAGELLRGCPLGVGERLE